MHVPRVALHVHGRAPVVNAVSIDVLRLVVAEIVDRARLEAIGRADEIVSATQVTKAELSCETREDGRCKSSIAHRVSLNAGAIALGAGKLVGHLVVPSFAGTHGWSGPCRPSDPHWYGGMWSRLTP